MTRLMAVPVGADDPFDRRVPPGGISQRDKSMGEDPGDGCAGRQDVLGELMVKVMGVRIRFLNFIREVDLDPTLAKVASYVGSVELREMATDLMALGHVHARKTC